MSTTWSNPAAAVTPDRVRVSKAACTTGTEALNCRGPYVAGTTYAAGDVVSFNGVPYLALGATTGNQPDISPASWSSLAQAGLDLRGLQSVGIALELAADVAIGAGAALQAYLLDPATGQINRAPGLDPADTITAGLKGQGLMGLQILGPVGRLIVLPSNVGAACSVFLNGSPLPSRLAL